MTEWLGKPLITREDIEKETPSMAEYFPALTSYYVEDLKMRLIVTLEPEDAGRLKTAVVKAYGRFSPGSLQRAVQEAMQLWLRENT